MLTTLALLAATTIQVQDDTPSLALAIFIAPQVPPMRQEIQRMVDLVYARGYRVVEPAETQRVLAESAPAHRSEWLESVALQELARNSGWTFFCFGEVYRRGRPYVIEFHCLDAVNEEWIVSFTENGVPLAGFDVIATEALNGVPSPVGHISPRLRERWQAAPVYRREFDRGSGTSVGEIQIGSPDRNPAPTGPSYQPPVFRLWLDTGAAVAAKTVDGPFVTPEAHSFLLALGTEWQLLSGLDTDWRLSFALRAEWHTHYAQQPLEDAAGTAWGSVTVSGRINAAAGLRLGYLFRLPGWLRGLEPSISLWGGPAFVRLTHEATLRSESSWLLGVDGTAELALLAHLPEWGPARPGLGLGVAVSLGSQDIYRRAPLTVFGSASLGW